MTAPTNQQQQTQQQPVLAPPPVQPILIGLPNETDFDATEAALAAILSALLLSWLLPGPSSLLPDPKQAWQQQIDSSLGYTIESYLQRTAVDLAATSNLPDASVSAADAVTEAYPRVMVEVTRWTNETYTHLVERDLAADELSAQIQPVADNIARAITNYARSEIGNRTAHRLGAVWSIWKTRHDDKVRSSHRGLDGNKVPFGGAFVTDDGVLIRFPGDPYAPLSETQGCRCHLVFRLQPKDSSYAEV